MNNKTIQLYLESKVQEKLDDLTRYIVDIAPGKLGAGNRRFVNNKKWHLRPGLIELLMEVGVKALTQEDDYGLALGVNIDHFEDQEYSNVDVCLFKASGPIYEDKEFDIKETKDVDLLLVYIESMRSKMVEILQTEYLKQY